jgi:hypothetical protein
MKAQTLALTIALALTACGGGPSSPTQPSLQPSTSTQPSPSTSSAASGVTSWTVTQRFGSVSGPDISWVREQRARWTPAVFPNMPMTITRSGGSINLDSPFFQVNYAGTFAGSEFSATGKEPLEAGGPQMAGVSNLSGRFSDDDRQLTATEVNTYRLISGETVTYTWEWQASR